MATLYATQNQQVIRNLRQEAERAAGIDIDSRDEKNEIKTRLAIVRPFWNSLEEGYWPLGRGRRHHDKDVGCPPVQVKPGHVYVVSAPNFFCNTKVLTERLLGDGGKKKKKKGVKIIHLVRNPFDLALSNWIYHSQDPTPEDWVNSADPCKRNHHGSINVYNIWFNLRYR